MRDQNDEPESQRNGLTSRFVILLVASAIPLVLLLLVRLFAFQLFSIPASSGVPNLIPGDYVLVSKLAYLRASPQRGDIAVFRLPKEPDVAFVKRVIGLPGDHIQVLSGRLHINGMMVERSAERVDLEGGDFADLTFYRETLADGRSYVIAESSDEGGADNTSIYEVPPGHYFVMGDSRDNSQDSRYLDEVGYISEQNFVGKVVVALWNSHGVPTVGRPTEQPAN